MKVKASQLCPTPWTVILGNSPGQNTGSLSLLQGIFPTQGSNPAGTYFCRQLCEMTENL